MSCINNETKSDIINKIEHSNILSSEAQILAEFIEELPKCTSEELSKGKKSMRPLSKYNLFLSVCLKKDKSMTICVPRWRSIKECMKLGGSLDGCKVKEGY